MSEAALRPQRTRTYDLVAWNSARWDGFVHRPGDIVVCTAYKAGTTWTQMICALLIFQEPDLPAPMGEISPWLEMEIRPVDEMLAAFEGQDHRRFVKSHTPLDGIPYWDDAVYLVVGRDPRDIFISMQDHIRNMNPEVTRGIVARRMGIPVESVPENVRPMPEGTDELAKLWLSQGSFPWERDGFPFWSVFSHASSFWRYQALPNVHFLHYDDLKRDLEGEMRRLAALLGITVQETKWPALVEAAGFESMRDNAAMTAPDAHLSMWKDSTEFFKSGTSGRWRGIFSEETLALFEQVMAERMEPALRAWMLGGRPAFDPEA